MAALFGIMYGLYYGSQKLFFFGLCETKSYMTHHQYFTLMNFKRLLFFFGPFGGLYLLEKKVMPEDNIPLVYTGKLLLFGGFMILYLAFYPRYIYNIG